MIINLDSIIEHYIKIAQDITSSTGEEVQVVIKDQPIVETFMDRDELGEYVPFTKYYSKLNFIK
jgi:hypothetical protein